MRNSGKLGVVSSHSNQRQGKPATKRRKVKGLTEVRSPQRKLMPDRVGSGIHEQTSLWGIARTAKYKKEHRFKNLYGLLTEGMLKEAWKGLDKRASIADDNITIRRYEENLEENLKKLWIRLKEKKYRAKFVKRKYIPKDNGKERPLGIPALEDKIVQKAAAMILEVIYEQDFLDCSYGYRANRSPKEAVGDLNFQLQYGGHGYIVEADIKGFFDNINHEKLLEILKERIDDKAFIRLIRKWLKAGILEPEGYIVHPDSGTPQGGIVSPILANLYLHKVLDEWFESTVKRYMKGRAIICRYADDWVCAFQYKRDAERFYEVMSKRLGKYGLKIEASKTRIVQFSRFNPGRERNFNFLGFEFNWEIDRQGKPRVKRRTSRKKQLMCIKRIKEWIKKARHLPIRKFMEALKAKLLGHYNYYYVVGNSESVWSYYWQVMNTAFKWLNRRSQRKSYTWEEFRKLWERLKMPVPKVTEKKRIHNVVFG